jgi:7-cyano-7-deazaguanine synthase in queuosine biosynthesis
VKKPKGTHVSLEVGLKVSIANKKRHRYLLWLIIIFLAISQQQRQPTTQIMIGAQQQEIKTAPDKLPDLIPKRKPREAIRKGNSASKCRTPNKNRKKAKRARLR